MARDDFMDLIRRKCPFCGRDPWQVTKSAIGDFCVECVCLARGPSRTTPKYAVDAWNSFQCVRIPDAYARECAAWVRGEKWITQSPSPELPIMYKLGNGDDTFFHEFMACMHPYDVAENLKPNIVEHVDWLLGGSSIQKWRDYIARAEFFEDTDLVDELRERIKRYHNER